MITRDTDSRVVLLVIALAIACVSFGVFRFSQSENAGAKSAPEVTIARVYTVDELTLALEAGRMEYYSSSDPTNWLIAGSDLAQKLRDDSSIDYTAGPALREIVLAVDRSQLDAVASDKYLRIMLAFDECTRESPDYCWWDAEDAWTH